MSHATVLVALDAIDRNEENAVNAAVEHQMAPFDEAGHWGADGSRWDWYQIGGRYSGRIHGKDIVRVSQINQELLLQEERHRWTNWYREAEEEIRKGTFHPIDYGFDPREKSLDEVLEAECTSPLSAYAFLRNRHWHEAERLGWFGGTFKTECEIKNPDDADIAANKCLYKHEDGSQIIVWNEPNEIWEKNFWKRFIEPLTPDMLLVMVDYHV